MAMVFVTNLNRDIHPGDSWPYVKCSGECIGNMRASVQDISLQVFRVVQCQYESKFKGQYSENMKESLASGAVWCDCKYDKQTPL